MGKIIQDQILGMKWLNVLIGKGLSALGLDTATRWGGSIQFFLYDVIKITILLCMLRKAIKPRLLSTFIAICIVGIILVGYGFNAFQYIFI